MKLTTHDLKIIYWYDSHIAHKEESLGKLFVMNGEEDVTKLNNRGGKLK